MKVKILQVALAKQDYNLAAHVILYGMIKAKVRENPNGKKGSIPKESKRP
ncbi:MAG: hypothetical protein ACUVX1_12885 [Chloroflexota bacterium]